LNTGKPVHDAFESYTHSEVVKIFKLPSRRIVHWSQNGLIEAEIEASGAGSKRRYTFINLLEFALCEEFFSLGLGIQSVKKILKELRDGGDLKLWVEDFESYYKKIAAEFAQFYKSMETIPSPVNLTDSNPFLWFQESDFDSFIKDNNGSGILFYFFKGRERLKALVPLRMDRAIEAIYSYKGFSSSSKTIIINIGSIKLLVEQAIDLNLDT
jgi:DNA-binding transcriptional MerR regulator